MKYPKIPTKPWAPYKPQPPAKQIEQQTKLGELSSQEDSTFSIQWFVDYIKENFPTVDPASVRFTAEVNKHYGYYDEVSTSLDFKFFTVSMVDNPNYDRLYKSYEEQLAKYKKDYEEYKSKLEQYKKDEKQYKKDCELWQLENAKAIIARHDKKTTRPGKKAIGAKK